MRPIWLIESGVYGEEATPLLAEIHRQGMIGELIPHSSLKKGSTPKVDGKLLTAKDCVIGYGTFPFARQIQLYHPWIPGVWCNPENLDCSLYYAYFGKFLLNQHYTIMPGVEAIRQRDWLFSIFGVDDRVFVRPTGTNKFFVGRCIDRESFISGLAPTRYDPATLVVIASAKPISREWRLIVLGNRVLSGSQYAVNGQRAISSDCPSEVRAFAESILAEVHWRPDPIFMLDICESEGRFWLIELNSFSCSWLYQCDLSTVVAEASNLAQQMWETKNLSSDKENERE